MKYQKARFIFTDGKGGEIKDKALLQTVKDIMCCFAGEAGFESFEEDENGMIGYVQKHMLDLNSLRNCIEFFPVEDVKISYELDDAEDKNWNEKWESEGFEPIFVSDKCVIHDTIHPVKLKDKTDMLDITIDARQAFGTGNHETTYMIVDELLNMDLSGKNVLDCGCGTGILSIIASKLGAEDIIGYDIDEWSVRNAEHNCEINKVDGIKVLHGDVNVISTIKTRYDVILANINRNILLNDMPMFRQKMKNDAVLLLSGFYIEDSDILIQKAKSIGLELAKKKNKNNWCMLVFK